MLDPATLQMIAPLAAGVGVVATILASASFFAPEPGRAALKKRMAMVKDRRRELRSSALSNIKSQKDLKDERNLAMMRRALQKFKMEEMITSSELKLKLARAGRRGRNEAVRFLFMRLVMPPVLAFVAFFYLYFVVQPEDFDALRYAIATLAVAVAGYYLPGILLENQKQKRQSDMLKAYPDALDLLTICVESGMSIEQSFQRVGHEVGQQSIALAEELQLTTAELSYLGDRRQALENFANRTGLSQVRAITSAMIQAERYGTPIAQALRVISQESRDEAMSRAEQKAAALPAKLTIPMIVFFVPVLFIVILGPAILQMMEHT